MYVLIYNNNNNNNNNNMHTYVYCSYNESQNNKL